MARSALPLRIMTLALFAAGCGRTPAPLQPVAEQTTPAPTLGDRFDASETGTIRGHVVWNGPIPESHSFREAGVVPGSFADQFDVLNRLVPQVNAKGNGVAGAVVYLRKVDLERSRPWNLPPVRVEMNNTLIGVGQLGEHVTGFVHVGDAVEMVSHGPFMESLRARGAAFFTLPFPQHEKSLQRKLAQTGLVELSSALGNYWARSWLFVVDHPYYVRTDDKGQFELSQVPDGAYELVCWMPDWRVERFERDPETFLVARVWFKQPLEMRMAVKVEKNQVVSVEFNVGIGDFGK